MITVRVEGVDPTGLATPTERVRWFELEESYAGFPVFEITGNRDDVVQFLSDHWGAFYEDGLAQPPETDAEIDIAVELFLTAHAVK